MAIDKKQQTKQEQRQPETRQETAQAAAPSERIIIAPSDGSTEAAFDAVQYVPANKEKRPDTLIALKHLVRAKVPARLEEPLQGLITEIFCDPARAPSKTTLDSLTLLRDLLASDHLHGDATHDISKAIEALA